MLIVIAKPFFELFIKKYFELRQLLLCHHDLIARDYLGIFLYIAAIDVDGEDIAVNQPRN